MKIHNLLPILIECLKGWKTAPSPTDFDLRYFSKVEPLLRPMLQDWGIDRAEALHAELLELDWDAYRAWAVNLDPASEEKRLRKNITRVEKQLSIPLRGEAVLFGSFELMDGYARFERGSHRVFLGIDEKPSHERYFDILECHELTHVARETQPSVWAPFGLTLEMSHDDFTQNLPIVEHLFNEGFACAVSELLNPGADPWHYVYQDRKNYEQILRHASALDVAVHRELERAENKEDDYARFYNPATYHPRLPLFCHYTWAWAWAKELLERQAPAGPADLAARSSKDFLTEARAFRLAAVRS